MPAIDVNREENEKLKEENATLHQQKIDMLVARGGDDSDIGLSHQERVKLAQDKIDHIVNHSSYQDVAPEAAYVQDKIDQIISQSGGAVQTSSPSTGGTPPPAAEPEEDLPYPLEGKYENVQDRADVESLPDTQRKKLLAMRAEQTTLWRQENAQDRAFLGSLTDTEREEVFAIRAEMAADRLQNQQLQNQQDQLVLRKAGSSIAANTQKRKAAAADLEDNRYIKPELFREFPKRNDIDNH